MPPSSGELSLEAVMIGAAAVVLLVERLVERHGAAAAGRSSRRSTELILNVQLESRPPISRRALATFIECGDARPNRLRRERPQRRNFLHFSHLAVSIGTPDLTLPGAAILAPPN